MKLKVCNEKTKLMFPEYRDMIQQLREDNPHFSKMFDDHEALDQEICLLEQDPVRIHRGEIEPLKRKKLFIKDQLYRILKGAQLKTS